MSWLIGEIAEKTGLTPDTLRYYERIGLLPRPGRSSGGHRIYRERDLDRLHFIRRAQTAGFTLDEIGQLLRFREDPANSSRQVRELAARKQQAIRDQLELFKNMEAELALLIALCAGGEGACPILEHLDRH